MPPSLSYQVAESLDEEHLVAELWDGDVMWGEITLADAAKPMLLLYANPSGEPWRFDLAEMQETISKALARLKYLLDID